MFRRFALAAQKTLNRSKWLEAIEHRLLRQEAMIDMPAPVLMVGAPRGGTTLLYELLAANYQTAYISNLAALLYRSPVLATRTGLHLFGRHTPRYRSDIGYISGVMAPSEAGELIRHWFTGASPLAVRGGGASVRSLVANLSVAHGGPLVLKNLYLESALDLVLATFPEIVALRIARDSRFTAQSILATREMETGSREGWWGPKPRGHEALLTQDAINQVAWQVRSIEAAIDRLTQRRELAGRVFACGYADLCANPAAVLDAFANFYRSATGRAIVRLRAVPGKFPISNRIRLSAKDWAALEKALSLAPLRDIDASSRA
jgi:hypothetical protein